MRNCHLPRASVCTYLKRIQTHLRHSWMSLDLPDAMRMDRILFSPFSAASLFSRCFLFLTDKATDQRPMGWMDAVVYHRPSAAMRRSQTNSYFIARTRIDRMKWDEKQCTHYCRKPDRPIDVELSATALILMWNLQGQRRSPCTRIVTDFINRTTSPRRA